MNDLQLIVDSRSSEFKDFIYEKLKKSIVQQEYDEHKQAAQQLYTEYFSLIDPFEAMSVLYNALQTETDEVIINKILSIIKTYDLVDYGKALKLLNSESLAKKKIALRILSYNKPTYVIEDISEIKNVAEQLKLAFFDLSNMSTKKGFLSSNEKEVWICKCGKSNEIDDKYCSSCYNDKKGFKAEELRPETVINGLNDKVLALDDLFTSTKI